MNLQTAVVLIVLALLLFAAVRAMWKSNGSGHCSGCGEQGCAGHGAQGTCPSVSKALEDVDRKLGAADAARGCGPCVHDGR